MRYLETTADILRVGESGIIEQYDAEAKEWRLADNGMSGIYSGDVEYSEISKEKADEIIKRWADNAD